MYNLRSKSSLSFPCLFICYILYISNSLLWNVWVNNANNNNRHGRRAHTHLHAKLNMSHVVLLLFFFFKVYPYLLFLSPIHSLVTLLLFKPLVRSWDKALQNLLILLWVDQLIQCMSGLSLPTDLPHVNYPKWHKKSLQTQVALFYSTKVQFHLWCENQCGPRTTWITH